MTRYIIIIIIIILIIIIIIVVVVVAPSREIRSEEEVNSRFVLFTRALPV